MAAFPTALVLLAVCGTSLAVSLPSSYPEHINTSLSSSQSLFHGEELHNFLPRAVTTTSDGTTLCSITEPCAVGCCGNGGNSNNPLICGTGPTFCGPGNCTGTCDYKAGCNPGNSWPSQYANATNCPLNVCCSQYGFCGTTEGFCGDAPVPQPSCSSDAHSTQGRRIAYYEGWTTGRTCDVMMPSDIPVGLWTHLNVAFASIDPDTYEVSAMAGVTNEIIDQVAALKSSDSSLKVYLSVGGWSFNDAGPTLNTFSDLAASTEAQQPFFGSLISFLLNNNLDGVDIDWEYPGASDRGGDAADFTNFPSFLKNLREELNGSGYEFGLTITAPSSYWYLQNFDIITISQIIDWFNVMTYDLHGVWDANDPYIGDVALAHTNLTEIIETMDLFWRNNIDPSKITLGLGFYGRSFTMDSSDCMEAGCPFSSGGNPGPCTQNSGTLSAEEIRAVIAGGATVTLDPIAAVEIVTWDENQWVSYDDLPTFQMKMDYANSVCLGGVMVWAVDLDDLNATSTNELALAMGLSANSTAVAVPTGTLPAEDTGITGIPSN